MTWARRIATHLGIGRVSAPPNETQAVQYIQVSHQITGEVQDGVPSVQIYGLAASPLVGCDHIIAYAEGDRSKGIAIASNDQRFRPKNMLQGEVMLYDNATQRVYFQSGTKIVINATSEIDVQIGNALVMKITSGGVAVTGNITATGDITGGFGGSDVVEMQHHTHTYIPGSGSATQTSGPVAGT
jgi:phage baseplate assembly protein V